MWGSLAGVISDAWNWLVAGWPTKDYGPSVVALAALVWAVYTYRSSQRREQFKLGIDLILKLGERFDGMQGARARAATALLAGTTDDNRDVNTVLDFFEEVAFLLRRGAIDAEAVYTYFGYWLEIYDRSSRDYRLHNVEDLVWEEFDPLAERVEQFDAWRRDRAEAYGWVWHFRRVYQAAYLVRRLRSWERPWGLMNDEMRNALGLEAGLADAEAKPG